MTQPVDSRELVATVRTLLRLRHAAAELRTSETRRRVAETLAEVGGLLTQSLDLDVVAQRIVDSIRALFHAPAAALYRLDPHSGNLLAVATSGDHGPTGGRPLLVPAGAGTVGLAVLRCEPVVTADALTDCRLTITPDMRARIERAPIRAVLAVPLTAHDQVIGALAVGDGLGRRFPDEEIQLAETFAHQAAVALENARLFDETERRRRQAESLAEVGRLLAQSLNPEDVAQRIADTIRAFFGAITFILYRVRPAAGDLAMMALSGDFGPGFDTHVVLPRGIGAAGLALATRASVMTSDILADARVPLTPEVRDRVERAPYRSVLAVPLLVHDRVIGVLAVGDRAGRVFTADEVRFAQLLADHSALALENSRLYAAATDARDFLRSVAENSADAIVTTDATGRITYLSQGGEQIFGYRADEVVGRPAAGYSAGGPSEAQAVMRSLAANGQIRNYETAMRAKDGRLVDVSLSFSLLRDAGGAVVGTLGVMKDVSERKRAQEALAESKELLRTIIETEPECVKLVAADGTLIDMNRAGLAMIEADALQQVAGKPVEPLVAPEDRPAFRALSEAVFRGESGQLAFDIVGLRGTRRSLETHAVPLRNQKGDIIALLGVTRDVTERKRAEEALRESEAQLRQAQKMEAIGRLAGGVAHDFNNLLTVVAGRTQLLLLKLGTNDPLRRQAEIVDATAQRAARLTHQLLAFSRKQVLQPHVLDLNEVIAGARDLLERLLGEDIRLIAERAPGLGHVLADRVQLELVIVNLAVNARDAMPEGGRLTFRTANVDLDVDQVRRYPGCCPGRYVMLRVADTGHGMDAETQARVFEPFFTTKGPGKGTGLGLATAYGIIKQSGGYIHVESEPERGATFSIYLPRIEGPVHHAPRPPSQTLPRGTETILLVEDDAEVRGLAREILEMQGYRVLTASDAKSGLLTAQSHQGSINLLLTDVVMPETSGPRLAEQVSGMLPDLQILYMSGYTDDSIVHRAVREAGKTLLPKPFTPQTLSGAVRGALDARHEHAANATTAVAHPGGR